MKLNWNWLKCRQCFLQNCNWLMISGWLLIVGLIGFMKFTSGSELNSTKSNFNNNQWNREIIQSELSCRGNTSFIQPLIDRSFNFKKLFAQSFLAYLANSNSDFINHSVLIFLVAFWLPPSLLIQPINKTFI